MVSARRDPLRIALALAEARTVLGLKTEAFTLYGEVVAQLLADDRTDEALSYVNEMIALDPHDPIGHLKKAECHARLGDIDATVTSAGHAVPLFLQRGEVDVALELLERMLSYWPDPACAMAAARIYLDRGGARDGVAALQKLQICHKAQPEDLDTLLLLARAFDAIGQPHKADRVLQEAATVAEMRGDRDAHAQLTDLLDARMPQTEPSRPAPPLSTRAPKPPPLPSSAQAVRRALPLPSGPPSSRRAPPRSGIAPKPGLAAANEARAALRAHE